jgi:hypothetical protein
MNNHYYAGSCVDLFDAEGMSLGVLPYEDVTEFAQAVETWRPVSHAEVREQCCIPESMAHLLHGSALMKDAQYGVYVLYHLESDTHYFFIA